VSENQRVKLAQELHDGIAQDLVGLGYFVDSLIGKEGTAPDMRAELRTLRFRLIELIEKVRAEMHNLRLDSPPLESEFEPSINYELSKIFAELIRNVQQHADATSLTISVHDNGHGGAQPKSDHFGLLGIQERVKNLSGSLEVNSESDGTRVAITIPLISP